jgi:DNA-binding MarR family transcriptional regulator
MLDQAIRAIQATYPQIYYACHTHHARAVSNAYKVSARDSMILGHLDEERPASPKDLAKHLGIRASTLSAALAQLEGLGYITRRPRERDRRHVDIFLAPKGVAAMQATSVLDTQLLREVLAPLGSNDLKTAVNGLGVLARAASAAMARADHMKPHWGKDRPAALEKRS